MFTCNDPKEIHNENPDFGSKFSIENGDEIKKFLCPNTESAYWN
jgi:hypothetical protein